MEIRPIYYHDYLDLDKIIKAQHPVSKEWYNDEKHDEMLFIVTHQAFELWFVQINYELKSVIELLNKPFDDNLENFPTAVHRLERIREIWKHLVEQYSILETMTSLDFLDFRKYLVPGSGFQSHGFKNIEAMMGLNAQNRYSPSGYDNEKGPYYKRVDVNNGAMNQEHSDMITATENNDTLFDVFEKWLKRSPFFDEQIWDIQGQEVYWETYIKNYYDSLADRDKQLKRHEELRKVINEGITIRKEIKVPLTDEEKAAISSLNTDKEFEFSKNKIIEFNRFDGKCVQAMIFISINRHLPIFHLPYRFITLLMDIDELISMWRYRHLIMVKKTMGERTGTGKTSGADYLKNIVEYNTFFPEIKFITTFLIERMGIPELPEQFKKYSNFSKND